MSRAGDSPGGSNLPEQPPGTAGSSRGGREGSPGPGKRRHSLSCQAAPPLGTHPPSSPLPQLFSLQAPLKTLLQLTIMPIINGKQPPARSGWAGAGARCSLHLLPAERTRKGVQIPLPEGMDFTREVVTNHAVREHGWDSPDPVAGTSTVPGGAQAQPAPG